MRKYKIAGLIVGFDAQYALSESQAAPYRVDDGVPADMTLEVGPKEIEWGLKHGMETPEYSEYAYMRYLFSREALRFQTFVLHASAVVCDGRAYLFSADSGTGKSTHTKYWLQQFQDRAYILNDDAPAVKKHDGQWHAFGTPWAGTSLINVDAQVPLQGIGFIERDFQNWAKRVSPDEAFPYFIRQTYAPLAKQALTDALDLCVAALKEIPIYRVGCALDPQAALTAYDAMRP